MIWLAAIAVLVIGLVLILSGRGIRHRRGLGDGRTLDLDSRTLSSAKYGLTVRPDRIIEGGIPEEWKSARRVYDSHRVQTGHRRASSSRATGSGTGSRTRPNYGNGS